MMEATAGRVEGCDGDHPGACYGELWTCAQCGGVACWAAGQDDDYRDLCDDCWWEAVVDDGV